MDAISARKRFHLDGKVYSKALLRFHGVDGYDVYNCSIPFSWKGKDYIFGRVELREDFANSTTWLFERVGQDEYAAVNGSMTYPLEDPYISVIGDELIMGGTHVRKSKGEISSFYGYFYRGRDPRFMTHFTCGPENMKDIRLVELADGRVGVFSRHRSKAIESQYGAEAVVGFSIIDSVDELDAGLIENAPYIPDLFTDGEWGGCNQCYLLKDGRVGVIGHRSYNEADANNVKQLVYINISFVFDPATHTYSDMKVIGDKQSYPATDSMRPDLADCAFTSGIVMRPDGKADLYSGLGDVTEGRITIDAPFGDLL